MKEGLLLSLLGGEGSLDTLSSAHLCPCSLSISFPPFANTCHFPAAQVVSSCTSLHTMHCVTLGKSSHPSEPYFAICKMGAMPAYLKGRCVA